MEGDFVETHDHLIFDVKGFLHPQDRVIAFLRYVPFNLFISRLDTFLKTCIESVPSKCNSQYLKWQMGLQEIKKLLKINLSDEILEKIKKDIQNFLNFNIDDIRIRTDGEIYIKIYDINARYDILTIIEPSYIFSPVNYDFPLQTVPISDILKIHRPEDALKEILYNISEKNDENNDQKNQVLSKLAKYLLEQSNIPLECIGISGSNMVGLASSKADYDLIIYGLENSVRVHRFLLKEFVECRDTMQEFIKWNDLTVKTYSMDDLKKHYEFRAKGFDITLDNFIRSEKRKTHQFFVENSEVFIRFLKPHRNSPFSEFSEVISFNQITYRNYGRIEAEGVVTNDEESFLTPSIYKIRLDSVLSINLEDKFKGTNELNLFLEQSNNQIEIYTLRGRFTEQAKIEEKVHLRGKIEYYILHDVHQKTGIVHSFRIVLGIDSKDVFYIINS